MAHDHHDHDLEDHDRGLSHDLPALLSRRRALALFGGAGLAAALAGCGITGGEGNGDITRSFGSASGVASGVPLTIRLKVLDTANGSGAGGRLPVALRHRRPLLAVLRRGHR